MKISMSKLLRVATILLLVFSVQSVYAQKKKKKKGDQPKTETPSKDAPKKIDDLIKKHAAFEGLFTIYQDSLTGKMKMLISLTRNVLICSFLYLKLAKV